MLKKLGLIVNPIAGMGGRVGLKGTDGVVEKARALGALPQSHLRALRTLKVLEDIKNEIVIFTASGAMGENIAIQSGFKVNVIEIYKNNNTTSEDTITVAKKLLSEKIDLLLFAGGDGTAKDIYEAIGGAMPVVGIPAGVKIHSPVYAMSPEKAGELAKLFLQGRYSRLKEEEIIDIDETAYRNGRLNTKLYGYLKIPYDAKLLQGKKSGSILSDEAAQRAIALNIVDDMKNDVFYIIGPGSTTKPIMEILSLPNTLLGVDIIYNKEMIKKDASEKFILKCIKNKKAKLIITPTGGQGYLLGRGNQQLSPQVIQEIGRENIIVLATLHKIQALQGKPFMVDTGDVEVDKHLQGYMNVLTGYREEIMYRITY